MAKVFISYKYGDDQVWQGLDQKYWAEETNPETGLVTKETKATGRAYVNLLEEIIGKENILKGEKQDESLEGKSEPQIWEILKPRVHDSSVTLVVISPGMKDFSKPENEQWMPSEIRYSLCEYDRGGRTSATNALVGVVLPDVNGNYEYIFEKSSCQHCSHIRMINKVNNPYLFAVLRGNIFNRKNDDRSTCQGQFCSSVIYNGDHSYMHLVTLNEFIVNGKHQDHIDKALFIKENKELYDIEKTI